MKLFNPLLEAGLGFSLMGAILFENVLLKLLFLIATYILICEVMYAASREELVIPWYRLLKRALTTRR